MDKGQRGVLVTPRTPCRRPEAGGHGSQTPSASTLSVGPAVSAQTEPEAGSQRPHPVPPAEGTEAGEGPHPPLEPRRKSRRMDTLRSEGRFAWSDFSSVLSRQSTYRGRARGDVSTAHVLTMPLTGHAPSWAHPILGTPRPRSEATELLHLRPSGATGTLCSKGDTDQQGGH